jgi:ubiquinone/menaquinone biosynthesis C-methylase UbiE
MEELGLFTRFLHWVVANPRVYDAVQYLLGFEQTRRRLAPYLGQTNNQTVLDVGGGTGNYARLVPRSATYFWLDNDPAKLRRFKAKCSSRLGAMLADATRICLRDKSVDCVVCIALAHHLSDTELPSLFRELARVVRRRLIFLDAVERKGSRISNLLWKFDRGRYVRSAQDLCSAMDQWFEREQTEYYTVYHHYLVCIGKPRTDKYMSSRRKPSVQG